MQLKMAYIWEALLSERWAFVVRIHFGLKSLSTSRDQLWLFSLTINCSQTPFGKHVIAFDKERVHNSVEIDSFGQCIHRRQFATTPPPPPSARVLVCLLVPNGRTHLPNL